MQLSQVIEEYTQAIFETDQIAALSTIQHALDTGVPAEEIVFDVVLPTLERMLETLVQNDDASLSQHFIAAKVSSDVVEVLIPRFSTRAASSGVVVIGTSRGDFHGLGKKIVSGCLTANMFTIHDLGLNVSPHRFVDEAIRLDASVIAISSMMLHTAAGESGPRGVKALLRERELTGKIKVIVGGAPYRFDSNLYRRVDADATAEDALSSIPVFKQLIREVQHV